MENPFHIRDFSTDDAAEILNIYQPYVLSGPYTFETTVPDFAEFETRLEQIANRFPFFVLTQDNKLLGYAYAFTHRERAAYRWAVETSVYLAPEAQGLGLGKQLYRHLLGHLKTRHFTHAFALIGLPNEASLRLHRASGFETQTIHTKAGWKNNNWIDVCWMKINLANNENPPAEPIFGKITTELVIIP